MDQKPSEPKGQLPPLQQSLEQGISKTVPELTALLTKGISSEVIEALMSFMIGPISTDSTSKQK